MTEGNRCAWHAASSDTTVANLRDLASDTDTQSEEDESSPPFEGVGRILDGASLSGLDLSEFSFEDTYLRDADLSDANLKNVSLEGAILSDSDRNYALLSRAYLKYANLSRANLWYADLTDAYMKYTDCRGTHLEDADLTKANLTGADLTGAYLEDAILAETDLEDADLTRTNLEHAMLVRTNLFGADLTHSKPHGASFTDVQINDDTEIRSQDQRKTDAKRWPTGIGSPPPRCGYDPEVTTHDDDQAANRSELLGKAADTYQTYEKLARENARPSLRSKMFILRQDMQRQRHRLNGEYLDWAIARLSRTVFKHGESLGRVIVSAFAIVLVYGLTYWQLDLITNAQGGYIGNPIDAIYFSTLTFTTLGMGDFQPDATSNLARVLVTSQAASGAVLIAIFVFVLGRRAAS